MARTEGAMSSRRFLATATAGVLALAACSDATGPPPDLRPAFLSVAGDAPLNLLRHEKQLETYQVSFWAKRGRSRSVEIDYLDPLVSGGDDHDDDDDGDDGDDDRSRLPRFLRLTIPSYSLYRRPDGTLFRTGDSVRITVSVDRELVVARFEPHGLMFSSWNPAVLEIWYGGASNDLDDDGDEDDVDDAIGATRLTVWYEAEPGSGWAPHTSRHTRSGRYFVASLLSHFSGYAVSW